MKRNLTRTLSAGVLLLLQACSSAPELQPFSSDGCSRFPDRNPIARKDWCSCCVVHDLAYWRGGSEQQRLQADQALKACVEQTTGDAQLAQTMYLGVRAGGGPELYTPYRWGYGWPFGRGYVALSDEELQLADQLEQEYRAHNPLLACPR